MLVMLKVKEYEVGYLSATSTSVSYDLFYFGCVLERRTVFVNLN